MFSPEKVLVGVFSSMNQAANVLGVRVSTVRFACIGTTVACQGWYLGRVEVSICDLGTLTLERFDEINGEKRLTYPDRGMRKKRTAKTIQQ